MSTATARDLRNHTADILRRVTSGGSVTITVHGAAVAELHPVRSSRPTFFSRADLVEGLGATQADSALRETLRDLAGDSTDDLDDSLAR
ncbi:MAG TPA: prevent-host-death family protein [Micrococcales bacterium]|uniref:type II toxin-antitoxin system Phd/YefM family antitoxin n=1 Tax=Miniimonas arenae TaxID=676201 RepID=UPI000ED65884|nr:type II toxin-antitoxin system prevent-host-death family antitoxin [Miniimonas arenae]HCX84536.1 prevent-host-death family protein [Micrococcales bacterium]